MLFHESMEWICCFAKKVLHSPHCPFSFTISLRISGAGRCVKETPVNFLKYSALNCGPLSDITSVGIPWWTNILLRWVTAHNHTAHSSWWWPVCYFHKPGKMVNHQQVLILFTMKYIWSNLSPMSLRKFSGNQCLFEDFRWLAHISHFSTFVWSCALRSGRQTDCLASSWHLVIPWCAICNFSRFHSIEILELPVNSLF